MARMFTRILVPTDFSATADVALEYARGLARESGATLKLLHVLEDPSTPAGLVADMYTPEQPDLRTALIKEAQTRLSRCLLPTDANHATTTEVIFGGGARTIVDYAASTGVDLIVMGTHGRTGLKHFVMGSVAEEVVRTAACPVLTVRHPGTPATIPATVTVRAVPA
jgi:nucleotide-binding universal stress UspA family protein